MLPGRQITTADGVLLDVWLQYLSRLLGVVEAMTNGPATGRPVPTFVGQVHIDQASGMPIFVKRIGPPAVWVNATGVEV